MFGLKKKRRDRNNTIDLELIESMRSLATPEYLEASLKRAIKGQAVDGLRMVSAWWDEPSTIRLNYQFNFEPEENAKEKCHCIGTEVLSDFPDVLHFEETFTINRLPVVVSVEI